MCLQYFLSNLKDLIIQDSKDDLQRAVRILVLKIISGVKSFLPCLLDRISGYPKMHAEIRGKPIEWQQCSPVISRDLL